MIICKILEDPQSSSCLNISYGEIQGLVANPHPTGSPYAPVSNILMIIGSEFCLESSKVLHSNFFLYELRNG